MAVNKQIFDTEKTRAIIEKGRRSKWWQRKGSKSRGFSYIDASGKKIADDERLERITSLVIPPAWRFVRISPSPRSNIQAVGMDTTGRIQYIYDPKFTERQQKKKFAKMEKFGDYLPTLRETTNRDLSLEGFPRDKVLAVMLRLINSLYFRVGTEKSARHYKTYGITTLQNRHFSIGRNGQLVFDFVGKSHIQHRKVLVDAELAAVMKELKDLGGARKLFHYLDEQGKPRAVRPKELNDYLKAATAPEFSSKDFRTWGGTLMAAVELAEIGKPESESEIKKNVVRAVKRVAEQLGNTPAVCRSSYIHPAVIKTYESGLILDEFIPRRSRLIKLKQAGYEPEETSLLRLLRSSNNGK
jgi:DNA topoisomerase-1